MSALSRKCKELLCNRGHGGKRRQSSSPSISEPRTVTPLQRAKEFTGEQLVVSSGKLFCNPCREELRLKSSSVKNHLRSFKHIEGKQKLAKRIAREQDMAVALKAHKSEEHLTG